MNELNVAISNDFDGAQILIQEYDYRIQELEFMLDQANQETERLDALNRES